MALSIAAESEGKWRLKHEEKDPSVLRKVSRQADNLVGKVKGSGDHHRATSHHVPIGLLGSYTACPEPIIEPVLIAFPA